MDVQEIKIDGIMDSAVDAYENLETKSLTFSDFIPVFKDMNLSFHRDSLHKDSYWKGFFELSKIVKVDMIYHVENASCTLKKDKMALETKIKKLVWGINQKRGTNYTLENMPFLMDKTDDKMVSLMRKHTMFFQYDAQKVNKKVSVSYRLTYEDGRNDTIPAFFFYIDKDNYRLDGYTEYFYDKYRKFVEGKNRRADIETLFKMFGMFNMMTAFAMKILACKNVSVIEIPKQYHNIHKKHSAKNRTYTISIKPMSTRKKYVGETIHTGEKRAMHVRRGHFADYTKGKGLFGKLKGMFWFDDVVVGAKAYGTVSKTYDLKI